MRREEVYFAKCKREILLLAPTIAKEVATVLINKELTEKTRAGLRARYEHRIRQKLAGREPVNLKITPTSFGTSDEGADNFVTIPADKVPADLLELFQTARGRMLLIGEPGAGKTTLLLQLALALLERGDKNNVLSVESSGIVLPVLVNLATWHADYSTLDNWLQRVLPSGLGVPKTIFEKIYHNASFIFLFDGLDEVAEQERASCLQAIGYFGANIQHQFVLSSRIREYKTTLDAPVYLEVEVLPLSPEQVVDNLTAYCFLQPEAKPLLNALKTDSLLHQAIESPFYLNTAQLLFASGRKYSEMGFAATNVAGRQRELVERFVEDALFRKLKREYQKEEARKWLTFLSKNMDESGKVQFELADMQPRDNPIYRFILCLIVGITPFVLSEPILIIASLFQGIVPTWELIMPLIGGVFLGIFIWLLEIMDDWIITTYSPGFKDYINWRTSMGKSRWFKSPISTTDIRIWSLRKVTYSLVYSGIMVIGLVVLSLFPYFLKQSFILTNTEVRLALYAGGILWIFVFLLGGITGMWFWEDRYLQISSPYQRFWASLKNLNPSILKHFAYRLALSYEGHFPLHLVRFLNEMSRRHLLEFDGDLNTETGGGSWRWRHRIIQEYFLEAPHKN